jgi:hypothetical protein
MELTMTEAQDQEGAAQISAESSLRRCIVTREALEKDQLIRFVLGPDAEIIPDLAGKLPGRGAWVKADRPTLAAAVKKNAFARSFETAAKVPADLVDRVAMLLDRQIIDLLGLARRSGTLVSGFEKTETALRTGKAALLIEARDAGKDGRAKLARHTAPGVEIWTPLPAEFLGRAIGRDHAVHVAVAPGGLARRLMTALRRQNGFSGHGFIDDGLSAEARADATSKSGTPKKRTE